MDQSLSEAKDCHDSLKKLSATLKDFHDTRASQEVQVRMKATYTSAPVRYVKYSKTRKDLETC